MANGNNMLIFVDAANTSYMNMATNFRGVSHTADDVLEIYFESATGADAYDKIIVSIANEKENEVMKALAGALQGNRLPYLVVMDDVAQTYAIDNLGTSGAVITSITLAAKGNHAPFENLITTKAMTAADSGKVFFLDLLAGFTVTLPSAVDAGAGWHCDIIVKTVTTSNAYIITEKTSVDTDKLCAIGLEAATTGAQLSNAGFTTCTYDATPTKGDKLHIICDGFFFYITSIAAADNDLVFA